MKIRHILVPIDYSSDAERALTLACELAQRVDAVLDLVHVYQIPSDIYPYSLYITEAMKTQIREREAERLETWCDKARSEGAAAVGHLVRGDTHEQIAETARRLQADLIVMGTRGRSGLHRALMGSTAERTVQLASCPVLTTP